MKNFILCDVPIYTLTKESFDKFLTNRRNKRFNELISQQCDEEIARIIIDKEYTKYSIWKYNQMIGFIEITFENKDVVFYLYLSDEKKHMYFSNVKKYYMLEPSL